MKGPICPRCRADLERKRCGLEDWYYQCTKLCGYDTLTAGPGEAPHYITDDENLSGCPTFNNGWRRSWYC